MTVTNKYFEYDLNLVPGQTARSGQIDSTYQAIQTALDGVETDVFKGIRFTDVATPAESDYQIDTPAVTRANKILGFDANGKPSVLSDAGAWSGDWTASTPYLARDFVRAPESHYFSLYIANVAHTSDALFETDLAAGRWALMVDMEPTYRSVIRHQLITDTDSPVAAEAGSDYMVDVTSGPVTITLPASPVITDAPINIIHVDGNLTTNAITIERNGELIMGLAEDMTVDVDGGSFGLAYCDATRGWRIRGV